MQDDARFTEQLNSLADGLADGSVSAIDGVTRFGWLRASMETSLGRHIGVGFAALPGDDDLSEAFCRVWTALNDALSIAVPADAVDE